MSYFNARRFIRSAGACAFAVTVTFGGTALADSTHAGNSTPSGGAALAASTSTGTSSSKSAQVSDGTSHHYPGDSVHMGDRILREGMSGHDVRVLQDFLTRAGYPTPIVGLFGPVTKSNVVAVQRAHNLKPNGAVTWTVSQALRAAAGTAPATLPSTIGTTATGPVGKATISNGLAVAPANASAAVKAVIAAGNRIAFMPYVYGGGHGTWNDSGYDCSGSVSYALHFGGLLSSSEDSSEFESYGSPGRGRWITLWANGGHVYMYVAGLRFDTSAQDWGGNGSRWTTQGRSSAGFVARHPTGF